MSHALSADQHAALHALAEYFMPSIEGFPTNADADPNDEALALAIEQLSPLRPALDAALKAVAAEDAQCFLLRIAESDPATYELLRTLLVGRYLMCRPVWDALGYTGKRPLPIHEAEFEHDLDDGILDPVLTRGKIYRPTPT